MAEHPGTPRTPDPSEPSDDALSPAAFEGLGLGSLSDDVRPSVSQWAAIEATADRRGTGRRPWLISAAAVVVLIVAVAGLVIARSGSEDPTVSTGFGGGGGPGDTYLLPPEGSSVIALFADPSTWFIQYVEPDGHVWLLSASSISGMDPTYTGPVPLGTAAQVSPFGLTYFQCSYSLSAGPGPSSGASPYDTAPTSTGTINAVEPVRATWGAGYPGASLIPTTNVPFWASQPAPVEEPCTLPTAPVASLAEQMSKLRRVSFAEWSAFLADNGEVRTTNPTGPPTVSSEVAPNASTTVVEDAPTDRASAEEQIAIAVAALAGPYDAESFPYLEDGTSRAAEYRRMFDTARRLSGAEPVDGRPATDFSLVSVRFTAPDRATIVMGLHTRLPTGEYDFSQDGQAILQDGRWVISYDTVARMLGRACLPPGGYDGCPTN
jgi:hypothetical protein